MREVELKSVAENPDAVVASLVAAGARRMLAGRLSDRRYDTRERALLARDHVLRLRVYGDAGGTRASLDWKGPTTYADGYKVREEVSTGVADADAMARILEGLGYDVIREIDRDITQYACGNATVRLEHYPRMDVLVEVEGAPEAIESAIGVAGLPRAGFTAERLPDFVRRFESRTGLRAALCERELLGDYRYNLSDA